jgi:hypothetical protein
MADVRRPPRRPKLVLQDARPHHRAARGTRRSRVSSVEDLGVLHRRGSFLSSSSSPSPLHLPVVNVSQSRADRSLSLHLQYFLLTQLVSFILIYPQLAATSTWNGAFTDQARAVGKGWFSVFVRFLHLLTLPSFIFPSIYQRCDVFFIWQQVLSAYTGTGMSLVDLGMVPFVSGLFFSPSYPHLSRA